MICAQGYRTHDGEVAHIELSRPKGNVLDAAMIGAIRAEIAMLGPPLKLLVFSGQGAHFSFGASVEEHLPGRVDAMLHDFHTMFRELEALSVPTAAVVRGQCLGGGFELALACGWRFVDPTAKMGVPEVKLGVFPPLACALLPLLTPRATELVVTGRTIGADEAVALGLATCADDPNALVDALYADLAPLSAVAVRQAWKASRRAVARALAEDLPALERQYLEDLMTHRDPTEGLRAFVERRPPRWEHR